jgi:hypothetical protein
MTAVDYTAVKAANPTLPLVIAGLAGPDTGYLDIAARSSRGMFDVINFHWYAEGDDRDGGKNPESGGLVEAIDRMRAWRDAHAPGKPIWITEFGWDTYAQSDSPRSKIYASEESAANYLLRAILMMQAHGIDRSFAFIYRDPVSASQSLSTIYNSAGIVVNNNESDGRKKTGWYYLAALKQILGDYTLDRIVSNGPRIYHYEYQIVGSDKRAAVLWLRIGERDAGYAMHYAGPAGTVITPTHGTATGIASPTSGLVLISERPIFVLYTEQEGEFRQRPVAPAVSPTVSLHADAGIWWRKARDRVPEAAWR